MITVLYSYKGVQLNLPSWTQKILKNYLFSRILGHVAYPLPGPRSRVLAVLAAVGPRGPLGHDSINWGKQEEILLWTGVEDYSSIYVRIRKVPRTWVWCSISIHEHLCYVCIAHIDPKVSEEEEQKSSLIGQCL